MTNKAVIIPPPLYSGVKSDSGKGNRESNLELYRIIAMLLIVAHHYVVNSGLTTIGSPLIEQQFSIRSLFYLVFGAWGKRA